MEWPPHPERDTGQANLITWRGGNTRLMDYPAMRESEISPDAAKAKQSHRRLDNLARATSTG
jgi:hypothetical protein